MRLAPRSFTDRAGRAVLLRTPEPADAAALLDCLKRTSGETPYLLRDPEEIDRLFGLDVIPGGCGFPRKYCHHRPEAILRVAVEKSLFPAFGAWETA